MKLYYISKQNCFQDDCAHFIRNSGLYYNNGHKEVVTSIHFVKILLENPSDSNPGQQVFSDTQSCAKTTLLPNA